MASSDLTCRELVEVVTDYLERALTPRERIRVEQHLVVCGACASYADQLRATIRLSGMVEPDELGPDGRLALVAALEAWMAEHG